jgi:alginate O-acetyltransferase complex protein AlgI
VRAWTGIYAFAFQLFADFWGYSTIAVGLGLLFGYELPLNFRTPYLSTSLREFWRRWHITLSSWFRDYVYVPLGGNKHHAQRNLIITMAIAGLWHGAGWTFVLWGLVNGVWLAVERLFAKPAARDSLPWRILKTALVFHGVCLCWVLFRAPDLTIASAYYQRLLLPPYTSSSVPSILSQWLIGFALLHPLLHWVIEGGRFPQLALKTQVAVTVTMVIFVLAFAAARIDFIYFTF